MDGGETVGVECLHMGTLAGTEWDAEQFARSLDGLREPLYSALREPFVVTPARSKRPSAPSGPVQRRRPNRSAPSGGGRLALASMLPARDHDTSFDMDAPLPSMLRVWPVHRPPQLETELETPL